MDLSWISDEDNGAVSVGNLRGKKAGENRNLFFWPSKEKGRRTPDHMLIYTKRLQISFRRCKNLRQAGRYAEITLLF